MTPTAIRYYTHNGEEETPYFAICCYTFGTNRVEQWSYVILDEDKDPMGPESERYENGAACEIDAKAAVGATEVTEVRFS